MAVRVYTDLVFFGAEKGPDRFMVIESAEKQGTALTTLKKIEKALSGDFRYLQDESGEHVNQVLLQKATAIFEGYSKKVAELSWFRRFFGGVDGQAKKVQRVYASSLN